AAFFQGSDCCFAGNAVDAMATLPRAEDAAYDAATARHLRAEIWRDLMKIVVIGGTGLIGSKVVERLRSQGHAVISAAPSSGINTLTGEGLDEAMNQTDVVVDLANSPSFEEQAVLDFFQTSGRNLLAAEKKAGVRHHVALSVVGTDRLAASPYFRGKIAQEMLVRTS